MNKWIPTSERLPDTDKEILMTVHTSGENIVVRGTYSGKRFSVIIVAGIGTTACVSLDYDKVAAWMPLPEPYKEDE